MDGIRFWSSVVALFVVSAFSGCSEPECEVDDDCAEREVCREGECVPGGPGADEDAETGDVLDTGSETGTADSSEAEDGVSDGAGDGSGEGVGARDTAFPRHPDADGRVSAAIVVELTWTLAGDGSSGGADGANLNLHFKHPQGSSWNQGPWDIFWNNPTADWGQPDADDDNPRLVATADGGGGPEILRYDNPASTESGYAVGVYAYDNQSEAPMQPTVRIFVDGELAVQKQGPPLSVYDFWHVGNVMWPGATVYMRDKVYEGFPSQ